MSDVGPSFRRSEGETTESLVSGELPCLPDSVGVAGQTKLKMFKKEMKGADM